MAAVVPAATGSWAPRGQTPGPAVPSPAPPRRAPRPRAHLRALTTLPRTRALPPHPLPAPAQIGSGAYGVVASAEDTATGRKLALKKVPNFLHDLVDAKARGAAAAARG